MFDTNFKNTNRIKLAKYLLLSPIQVNDSLWQ